MVECTPAHQLVPKISVEDDIRYKQDSTRNTDFEVSKHFLDKHSGGQERIEAMLFVKV